MARADRLRHPRAGTTLVLGLIALAVQAQTQPPPGSPPDVRYTATTAGDASLYPLAPGLDTQPPLGLRGEQAGRRSTTVVWRGKAPDVTVTVMA